MHKTNQINREDMLELTRRMTVKRNCFSRIAGAYMDEEGYVDGTFNTHFLKLSTKDKDMNIAIAKAIPFSETNVELKEYRLESEDEGQGSVHQLLMAIRECELKDDALLDIFYEVLGEKYQPGFAYGIYFFLGNYDIPLKATDKESLWESEEVYRFLICAVCPIHGDYEADAPMCGFMFPAFSDRSTDIHAIDIFSAKGERYNLADIFWQQK